MRAAGGLQIARGGGRGPRARRQRGAAAPSGDDRAGEREHHEKRRAIKGSSKGFFSQAVGGAFDSTFYVQQLRARLYIQHELARRLALDIFSIFLHQLAGRVRPVELVRPVQLITLAAPAGRRVNYQAATRRIHGPAGRTAARRVERRPVDGARTPRRVHGRRFPPVEEPRQ